VDKVNVSFRRAERQLIVNVDIDFIDCRDRKDARDRQSSRLPNQTTGFPAHP